MDASWQATHKKLRICLRWIPNYLQIRTSSIIYTQIMLVAHSDPEYTRANEVEDGRENEFSRQHKDH